MAWVQDEIGRAVGLPRVLGGIPLDELGATGWGIAIAAEVAAPEARIVLDGARLAIEGFGAVGQHAARRGRGARLVAASDSRGAIHEPAGLPVAALIAHKRSGRPLAPGREHPGHRPRRAMDGRARDPERAGLHRQRGRRHLRRDRVSRRHQTQAFAAIEERIRANTRETLERARGTGGLPRDAAVRMASERVREAMRYRRS